MVRLAGTLELPTAWPGLCGPPLGVARALWGWPWLEQGELAGSQET